MSNKIYLITILKNNDIPNWNALGKLIYDNVPRSSHEIEFRSPKETVSYKDIILKKNASAWVKYTLNVSKEHADEIIQALLDIGVFYTPYRLSDSLALHSSLRNKA